MTVTQTSAVIRGALLLTAVAVGTAFAGGVVVGGSPSATKTVTFYACVKKKGKTKGAMRLVTKKTRCRSGERKISWNQRGARGVAGAAGLPGAPGARGATGLTGATGPAGAAGADAVAPAHGVMFFNLAQCPAGWAPFTAGEGRYVVGLPSGGTLGAPVGTALSNAEDRPVGQHTHGVTDPGHSHNVLVSPIYYGGNVTASRPAGTGYNGSQANQVAGSGGNGVIASTTGISINNAGSVAGTNAPYVQLLSCEKQ